MRSSIPIASAVLVLTALALTPLEARGELAKWDQARVTQYATELASACGDLSKAIRGERAGVNVSQEQATHQAMESVKVLCKSCRQLQANLEAGKGRDATLSIYKKLPSQRRKAEEAGRRALITEPTMDKVFAVGGPMMRLRPYYESEPATEEAADDQTVAE